MYICTSGRLYEGHKTADLNIVFVTPLSAEVALFPSVVDIHECNVIPNIALVEELVSVVSVHSLVLGAIENGCTDRHHGTDGGDLHRALQAWHIVSGKAQNMSKNLKRFFASFSHLKAIDLDCIHHFSQNLNVYSMLLCTLLMTTVFDVFICRNIMQMLRVCIHWKQVSDQKG